MTSIRDEPVPALTAAEVVAALIGESDDRARQLARQLAAWREGYERGFTAGVDVGRVAEAHERDQAHARLARHVIHGEPLDETEHRRWRLRGETRTRQTFGRPHPADYRGGPVPWEARQAGAA